MRDLSTLTKHRQHWADDLLAHDRKP